MTDPSGPSHRSSSNAPANPYQPTATEEFVGPSDGQLVQTRELLGCGGLIAGLLCGPFIASLIFWKMEFRPAFWVHWLVAIVCGGACMMLGVLSARSIASQYKGKAHSTANDVSSDERIQP